MTYDKFDFVEMLKKHFRRYILQIIILLLTIHVFLLYNKRKYLLLYTKDLLC